MRNLFAIICLAFCVIEHCSAQLIYENGKLGFNLPITEEYNTRWGGIRHSWENPPFTASIEFVLLGNNVSIGATSQSNRIVFYSYKLNRYNDIMCQNILQSSDYKLKTNIVSLYKNPNNRASSYSIEGYSQITDAVKKLNPVSYQWKNDNSSSTQYGFIAQEVKRIFPDLVSETEDGTLAVNYVALIPILTTTIQELTDRITVLEERIKNLENSFK